MLLIMMGWGMGVVLASDSLANREAGGITIVLHRGLPSPQGHLFQRDGHGVARMLLDCHNISDGQRIVASSMGGRPLAYMGADALFRILVYAYANHHPVVLSPDMIWLLIAQGFARYVNAHPEQLRRQLVKHRGKMELLVHTDADLLSADDAAQWEALLDGFQEQIEKHTATELVPMMVADFSTTGPAERIASQITLVESVKPYFEYVAIRIVCGIPAITLTGAPDDWRQVRDKVRELERYGMGCWAKNLDPILAEFVRASEGHPNKRFWRGMVKKWHPRKLRDRGCSPHGRTNQLDGWFLKLFVDEHGNSMSMVPADASMPSEMVRAGFRYQQYGPMGDKISETPMELWAGIVGVEEDSATYTLTPRIGWIVSLAEQDDSILATLSSHNRLGGIWIRVDEVPDILSRLHTIDRLTIEFNGAVVLPQWMDGMGIKYLKIVGRLTDDEAEQICKRFPGISIERLK